MFFTMINTLSTPSQAGISSNLRINEKLQETSTESWCLEFKNANQKVLNLEFADTCAMS